MQNNKLLTIVMTPDMERLLYEIINIKYNSNNFKERITKKEVIKEALTLLRDKYDQL